MSRNLSIMLLLCIAIGATSCKKCYYCHNSCKVCQDAHNYTLVQSDVLSAQYYQMYIDSLSAPGLGWTCRDTAFNHDKQICPQDNKVDKTIQQQTDAGWTCAEVPN
jgi:hypothetical protein